VLHERYDMAAVRSWERTASGGVRLSAALTRTGILTYRDNTGREWREYRPSAEVFAEDSLRSLRGAPVTDLHPTTLVTPATWRDLAVGHVGDDVAREGELVVASVLVQDASEIARIEAGARKEVSAGYVCEVDDTPGVTPEGEAYDRVQRAVRYNHVALGPEGWGRAGAEVSLRLDAAVEVVRAPLVARVDDNATAGSSSAAQEQRMKKKLKIRGREIELRADADDGMAEAQGAVVELEKKADADAAELGAVKAALMDALTKVASLEAKMAAASAATPSAPAITEEAIPEEVLDSALVKRAALVESARKVLGADFDAKGKKPAEIKRAVIAKQMPNVKFDSLTADTVSGMFDAIVAVVPATSASTEQRNDALADAHAAAVKNDTHNADGAPKSLADRIVEKGRAPISGKAG
jgi:hypothetical protein